MKRSSLTEQGYKGFRVKVTMVREGRGRYEPVQLLSSEDVYKFVKDALENSDRERFLAIYLNGKNNVIGVEEVSTGSVTNAFVHPREVLKGAILANAPAIIVVHNHPSGDPEPSPEDKFITKRLKSTCDLMGITLLDHVIVGDGKFVSMKERDEI
jgi:DNA repair protein RadC